MSHHSPPQLLSPACIPPLSFSRVLLFHSSSPPLVLLSFALQSIVLGHGAVAVQLNLEVLITVMRLSLFLPVHPSRSLFIRQRFSRSVHLSSGPEPIRCIHPSLSRSVSPPHSVVSDSS